LDFNDVDFCLKVGEAGWRVVYTPFATLRHFESRSAKRMAFDALDQHRLMRRWEAMIRRDPFYNVNLRRDSQHFRALGDA
ncbi:MAG: glycosyltransferase family 2 protein, partial [Acetobacteraceae bacterium]